MFGRHLFEGKQRVSMFCHDLGLDLVGLIGNFLLVEQLLLLVVKQLLNTVLSSSHVSRKSLEEDEVTHILSRFLTSPVSIRTTSDTISWECFVKNDSVR